ncbi:MAG: polysaccharide pyruvyl transferase family protein [Verrucomicrobiota bacterium]
MTPRPKSAPTHILIGGAGAPNYGDELIVKGWLEQLAQPRHDGEAFIFCENSADTSRKFHITPKHPLRNRLAFRDDFNRFAKSVQDLNFWQQVERGFTFMRDFGFLQNGYKGTRDLFDARSFHLHGGGYLAGLWNEKGFILGLTASFAKLYGIPTSATGIGFGPFDSDCPDPARFAEILSHFQQFETRDADSHQLLTALAPDAGIIDGVDDTFLLPNDRIFRRDSTKRRLHLSLITRYLKDIPPAFWPWLVEQSAAFDEVVFWVSFPWEDREAIARAQAEIPRCSIFTARELVHFRPPIGEDDVFLTQRYHVHLAAARAGARGFHLAHNGYYRQKHESIVALGSGITALDFTDLPGLGNLPASSPLDETGLHERKIRIYASCLAASPA